MAIELLNIDCMEYMKTCTDKQFDLAIVDPPYGINATKMNMGSNLRRDDGWKRGESTAVRLRKGRLNSGVGHMKNSALVNMNSDWDFQKPSAEYFQELFRISVNQIIWGGNYFPLPPTRCIICRDKVQPWDNFSQWEMAWTSFDKPAKMFRFSRTGGSHDHGKIHPTQKPVQLYKFCLETFAIPGNKIIDTHSGSASIAIACHDYGFDLTACEIDAIYFRDSTKRYQQHISQLKIFN